MVVWVHARGPALSDLPLIEPSSCLPQIEAMVGNNLPCSLHKHPATLFVCVALCTMGATVPLAVISLRDCRLHRYETTTSCPYYTLKEAMPKDVPLLGTPFDDKFEGSARVCVQDTGYFYVTQDQAMTAGVTTNQQVSVDMKMCAPNMTTSLGCSIQKFASQGFGGPPIPNHPFPEGVSYCKGMYQNIPDYTSIAYAKLKDPSIQEAWPMCDDPDIISKSKGMEFYSYLTYEVVDCPPWATAVNGAVGAAMGYSTILVSLFGLIPYFKKMRNIALEDIEPNINSKGQNVRASPVAEQRDGAAQSV